DGQAGELYQAATDYGMDVLVEVHDEAELERAVALGSAMIGVNSRNLKTLKVDLETALRLASAIPKGVIKIAESGISAHADILRLEAAGYQGFLVGETLMRQPDLKTAVRLLLGQT